MNKEYKPFERSQQNYFSFWFPKVENCGIRVPKSVVVPVPVEVIHAFYMDKQDEDRATVEKFVKTEVLPKIAEFDINKPYFIKNGTFSNKFDANSSCLPSPSQNLTEAIIMVNYNSLCVEANGEQELVIRERIGYDSRITPCIYNGLPFRPEFRVFYDFDDQKVLFSVNYWDYDYIRRNPVDRLYDMTDKIIFDHETEKITQTFDENKDKVEQLVNDAMADVDELEGTWSVDLLLDEKGTFWLIDMAVAEQSAYWEWRNGKKLINLPPDDVIEILIDKVD